MSQDTYDGFEQCKRCGNRRHIFQIHFIDNEMYCNDCFKKFKFVEDPVPADSVGNETDEYGA